MRLSRPVAWVAGGAQRSAANTGCRTPAPVRAAPLSMTTLNASNPQPVQLIDLGKGHPPLDRLPHDEMAKAMVYASDKMKQGQKTLSLNYGNSRGNHCITAQLASFINRRCGSREATCEENHLFMTNGVSHGLELVCRALSQPGDLCLVEAPTYFLAAHVFKSNHLKVDTVPADEHGLDVDELERRLLAGAFSQPPRLVYIIPTHHNPTGTTLPAHRREKLCRLAREHDFVVVADEVYHLLSWKQDNLPHAPRMTHFDPSCCPTTPVSLPPFSGSVSTAPSGGWVDPSDASSTATNPDDHASPGRGVVVSVSSFTKIMAPALRLGWIEAAPSFLERFAQLGYIRSGGGVAPVVGDVVAEAMQHCLVDQYLDRLVQDYRHRVAVLCQALENSSIRVTTIPDGGYFMWCKLPPTVDASLLLPFAKEKHKVSFLPGVACDAAGSPQAHSDLIRLCFAHVPVPDLQAGGTRLAQAVEEYRHRAKNNVQSRL